MTSGQAGKRCRQQQARQRRAERRGEAARHRGDAGRRRALGRRHHRHHVGGARRHIHLRQRGAHQQQAERHAQVRRRTPPAIRHRLDGMCVNTIVLIEADAPREPRGHRIGKRREHVDQKKNTLAVDSDRSKRSNSQSASSDCTDEAAGEGIDAEQRGQLVDDAARRAERRARAAPPSIGACGRRR